MNGLLDRLAPLTGAEARLLQTVALLLVLFSLR